MQRVEPTAPSVVRHSGLRRMPCPNCPGALSGSTGYLVNWALWPIMQLQADVVLCCIVCVVETLKQQSYFTALKNRWSYRSIIFLSPYWHSYSVISPCVFVGFFLLHLINSCTVSYQSIEEKQLCTGTTIETKENLETILKFSFQRAHPFAFFDCKQAH